VLFAAVRRERLRPPLQPPAGNAFRRAGRHCQGDAARARGERPGSRRAACPYPRGAAGKARV